MPSFILASGIVEGSPSNRDYLPGVEGCSVQICQQEWRLAAWFKLGAGDGAHFNGDDRVRLERNGRLDYLVSSSVPSTLGSILLLNDIVYWSGGISPRRSCWLMIILAVLVVCRGSTVCTCLGETQTSENLPKHIDHHIDSFTICSIVILRIWVLESFHFLTYIKNSEIPKNYSVDE